MTRMQVLPLPTRRAGDYEETPFVLVVDQIANLGSWATGVAEMLRERTGACLVVCDGETVDLPGGLELTDAQREQLASRLMKPARGTTNQPAGIAEEEMARMAGDLISKAQARDAFGI